MVKEDGHYALYQDQDGRLHLAFRSQVFVRRNDFLEVRRYLYCRGRTRAELRELCWRWGVEPPSVLEDPPVEVEDMQRILAVDENP
jgi:hypothetical protein